ncbi:MAG: DinB family protein [Acidimicrobiia bacterium]|nr:DinB family protein [Acidimicrobiia bacterium]
MVAVKPELVSLSDEVWQRLRSRLEGLTDDEYLWDPTRGSWSIHERDGAWRHEWVQPSPEPAPFTTLAWRLWHLIDMYGEDRAPLWLDVSPHGEPIGLDDPNGASPSTAGGALALLEAAHDRWDAHLALVTEEALGEQIGPVGGGYAERTRGSYVLHMLDEFVHHGAEVSLLRDLWRWQRPLHDDPLVDRAMRGDLTVAEEVVGLDAAAGELMRAAAAYGRWDLVVGLVRAGVAVPTLGRTPLHQAAGAGELAVVQLLVAHGGDVAATDPLFHAPPIEWARFLGHQHVVDWFDALTAP